MLGRRITCRDLSLNQLYPNTYPYLDGPERSMRLTVDGVQAFWCAISEYEGSFSAAIGPQDDVLQAMMSGNRLLIDLPGYSTTASLSGSRQVLDGALRYCATLPAAPALETKPAPDTAQAAPASAAETLPGSLSEQRLALADNTGLAPKVAFTTLQTQAD